MVLKNGWFVVRSTDIVENKCSPQDPLVDTRKPTEASRGATSYRAAEHFIVLTEEYAGTHGLKLRTEAFLSFPFYHGIMILIL